MKTLNENVIVEEVLGNTGDDNTKVTFDKEKAYLSYLASSKVNFWGEGLNKNEEWSL